MFAAGGHIQTLCSWRLKVTGVSHQRWVHTGSHTEVRTSCWQHDDASLTHSLTLTLFPLTAMTLMASLHSIRQRDAWVFHSVWVEFCSILSMYSEIWQKHDIVSSSTCAWFCVKGALNLARVMSFMGKKQKHEQNTERKCPQQAGAAGSEVNRLFSITSRFDL